MIMLLLLLTIVTLLSLLLLLSIITRPEPSEPNCTRRPGLAAEFWFKFCGSLQSRRVMELAMFNVSPDSRSE